MQPKQSASHCSRRVRGSNLRVGKCCHARTDVITSDTVWANTRNGSSKFIPPDVHRCSQTYANAVQFQHKAFSAAYTPFIIVYHGAKRIAFGVVARQIRLRRRRLPGSLHLTADIFLSSPSANHIVREIFGLLWCRWFPAQLCYSAYGWQVVDKHDPWLPAGESLRNFCGMLCNGSTKS